MSIVEKKVQKLLHGIANKEGAPYETIVYLTRSEESTRSSTLCLLNVGNDSGIGDVRAIEQVLGTLDGFKTLKVSKGRAFSFAEFESPSTASSAFDYLDNALFTATAAHIDEIIVPASKLTLTTPKDSGRLIHLLFAKHVPFPAQDTLTDPSDILRDIPGLHIIPDFITEEEEASLVQGMDLHPWINLSERQVQHHGFTFDYNTNQIDFKTVPGPLPSWCQFLMARMDAAIKKLGETYPEDFSYRGFNQLTLNKYPPGSG
ncbi:hypothetical protein HDU79_000290 [Rhizoclosmatium sp. JEL0117]|nr:hypothetical protein HDU79_000290 [Rhizoclosmatium sp. JEL0117]